MKHHAHILLLLVVSFVMGGTDITFANSYEQQKLCFEARVSLIENDLPAGMKVVPISKKDVENASKAGTEIHAGKDGLINESETPIYIIGPPPTRPSAPSQIAKEANLPSGLRPMFKLVSRAYFSDTKLHSYEVSHTMDPVRIDAPLPIDYLAMYNLRLVEPLTVSMSKKCPPLPASKTFEITLDVNSKPRILRGGVDYGYAKTKK